MIKSLTIGSDDRYVESHSDYSPGDHRVLMLPYWLIGFDFEMMKKTGTPT